MIGWIGPHRENGFSCLQPEQVRDDAEPGPGETSNLPARMRAKIASYSRHILTIYKQPE